MERSRTGQNHTEEELGETVSTANLGHNTDDARVTPPYLFVQQQQHTDSLSLSPSLNMSNNK